MSAAATHPRARKPYRRAYVEISNVCNLQCRFCPPVEREKQVMPATEFERLAPELAALVDEVCLHLMGEPLNHPEIARVLDACEQQALPVNLTTNGLLLTGERADLALRKIVRQVNVSVHSFAGNFPDRDPAPYLERVLRFVRRALAERPDLYVNLRLWDVGDAAAETADAGVRAGLAAAFGVPMTPLDLRRRKARPLAGRVAAHFDSRFTWPSPALPERTRQGFCHGLGSHFGVLADGTVVPCCLDKEAALALGNARGAPLAAALKGERARRMRAGFARGELVEDLCRRCPFVERFDGKARRLAAAGGRTHG